MKTKAVVINWPLYASIMALSLFVFSQAIYAQEPPYGASALWDSMSTSSATGWVQQSSFGWAMPEETITFPDLGIAVTSGSGDVSRGNLSAKIEAATSTVPDPYGQISNHCQLHLEWRDTLTFISSTLPDGSVVPIKITLILESQLHNTAGLGGKNFITAQVAGCELTHEHIAYDSYNKSLLQSNYTVIPVTIGRDDFVINYSIQMLTNAIGGKNESTVISEVNSSIIAKTKIFVQPLAPGIKCISASGVSYMNISSSPAINNLLLSN